MSITNEFYEYATPIKYPIYVHREGSSDAYVQYDICEEIASVLETIKKKILSKMMELEIESPLFEHLDILSDIIDVDIRIYDRSGICDSKFVINEDLEIIRVIESDYVDTEALEKYNIIFITEYDYSDAKKAFIEDYAK